MLAKNHYDDCPYNCNESGKILDTGIGKLVLCPYCSEKKKNLLAKGYVEVENNVQTSLSSVLGIENEFLSTKFVYDSVIPDGERLFIDEESLEWQKEVAEELYQNLILGEVPTESLCFGISIKGMAERFAYPMLAKAYIAGLTIGKFITCSEYNRLSFDISNSMENFYNSDFLMMMINEGCNLADISSAKGLMQTRALKGKPTVFLSTWTIEACSALLGFQDTGSYMLAKPVFVKYKKSKGEKEHSSYINKLIGVENEQVETSHSVSMSDLLG